MARIPELGRRYPLPFPLPWLSSGDSRHVSQEVK